MTVTNPNCYKCVCFTSTGYAPVLPLVSVFLLCLQKTTAFASHLYVSHRRGPFRRARFPNNTHPLVTYLNGLSGFGRLILCRLLSCISKITKENWYGVGSESSSLQTPKLCGHNFKVDFMPGSFSEFHLFVSETVEF